MMPSFHADRVERSRNKSIPYCWRNCRIGAKFLFIQRSTCQPTAASRAECLCQAHKRAEPPIDLSCRRILSLDPPLISPYIDWRTISLYLDQMALQGRFGALSRAHSLTMSRARDREQVATLHALIYKVTEPYLSDQAESRVVVTGPDIPSGPRHGYDLRASFPRFATNALKYGALAVAHGEVRIECRAEGDTVCITWCEHGKAGGGSEPLEEGFGSRLARATIEGPIGGSFAGEFKNDRVEIRLRLPRKRLRD